jgi:hypothetical protein
MPWTDEQVRDLVRESSVGIGGCPPAETLTRAVSGDLPRDQAGAVADHLSECADCAEDAQAVRSLQSWAGRAALDGASPGRRTQEIFPRRWTSRPLLAIAAALLVATTALSIALWRERDRGREAQAALQARLDRGARDERRLRDELLRLHARADAVPPVPASQPTPIPNVAIVDLLPAGASRSGASGAATVPAGAALVVCVLTVAGDTARYEDYAVEVWHGGRMAYRGQGFARSREDMFTVALPAPLLARGENRIRLLGLRGGRPVPLEEYALRIRDS